jgi:hypothetical protein
LADELGRARIKLTEHLLNHADQDGAATLIDRLKNERPREFAEATRLIAELKNGALISLAALQVVVRAISRLAGAA